MSTVWLPFSAAVKDVTGGNTKVPLKDYSENGIIPVIDQGRSFIGGYVNDRSARYKGPLPSILFGDHTRIFKFVDFPFALGADGVKALIPATNNLDPMFLYYCLTSIKIPSQGYSRHFKYLKETKILVPPLLEQHRIVDILNHAASIRRLRDEARAKVRELIPALFVEMFGDPATNPKGWEQSTLGSEIMGFEGGHSPKAGDEGVSPYRLLKLSAVTSGQFRAEESKPAPEGYVPGATQQVKIGDLLITRSNTVDLVGAIARVKCNARNLLLPDLIWRINFRIDSRILTDYIWCLLWQPDIRRRISILATGTSDSMRKLSQSRLRTLPIIVPPLPLQHEFADRVAEIEAVAALSDKAAVAAEQLVQSLLAQVFGRDSCRQSGVA